MTGQTERDAVTGTETTGHEWDGIKELDTPLPRWWVIIFYASIALSLVYFVLDPAIPVPTTDGWDYTKGVRGYSQRQTVARQLAEVDAGRAGYLEQIGNLSFDQIRRNQALHAVALAGGRSAFGDNCAGCHGSGAQGFTGFPNLIDDDWLWGGSLDAIHDTIRHGIRWEADDDTRFSAMPRFVTDQLLTPEQARDVTAHVLSISGGDHDAEAAARGAPLYQEQCALCHGEQGLGDQEQGAPNLTDAIWLYGGDAQSIYETIALARNGVMPAWTERLDPAVIKELALYVHSLGGGEDAGDGVGSGGGGN